MALSKKNSSIQIREKILNQIMQVYTMTQPTTSQQSQFSYINQACDDILEALSYKSEVLFLAQVVGPLIQKEASPKLQALLRMVTCRIRNVN